MVTAPEAPLAVTMGSPSPTTCLPQERSRNRKSSWCRVTSQGPADTQGPGQHLQGKQGHQGRPRPRGPGKRCVCARRPWSTSPGTGAL